jgi:hypothetical protein
LGMIGKISTDGVPGTFCQTLASIFILSHAHRQALLCRACDIKS